MIPKHGGQLRLLAERYGIATSAILDFSANINPAGPPPSVVAALHKSLEEPFTLCAYPDLELHSLKQHIAGHLAIDTGSISVANGFVPLMEAAIRTRRIRRCLLPVPAFSEYRRTLELCGVEAISYPLQPHAFAYDPDLILGAIRDAQADAILIANPQNPSGRLASAEAIKSIAEGTAASVLLDEAFIDYSPEASLTTQAPDYANVIVFRSVTKFFAMPGLRIAYAVAHPDTTKLINNSLAPWPVSSLAAVAVQAALEDIPYQQETRKQNVNRRDAFISALMQLGIEPAPAAANFLLLPLPFDADAIWQRLLKDHHILLRNCSNFESLTGHYLRTAIRTASANDLLIAALAQVLGSRSLP